MSEKDWLCTKDAASYLATLGCFVSPRTLENMRCNNNAGGGPAFTRSRWKTVRYLKADLDIWAKQQTVRVA